MSEQIVDKKRIGYCRDMARKILSKYGEVKHPIDIFKIAEEEGFDVKSLNQPKGFSGILNAELKAIGINENHHPHRQRFSISHEMGHYYLGHPPVQELQHIDEGAATEKIHDTEANEFAGELLVPMNMLKKEVKIMNNIEDLAIRFNVSKEVMTIQVMKHGLLNKFVNINE